MEFLSKMKKREFIEMGLKTAIALLLGVIVIFFMEAMIYSIHIKKIDEKHSYIGDSSTFSYYYAEQEDGKYKKYIDADGWACDSTLLTEEEVSTQIAQYKKDGNKCYKHQPNAFDIYLNGVHYAVMAVFLVAIAGVFVWRFTLINKEYKKMERKFKKTGKLFA